MQCRLSAVVAGLDHTNTPFPIRAAVTMLTIMTHRLPVQRTKLVLIIVFVTHIQYTVASSLEDHMAQ